MALHDEGIRFTEEHYATKDDVKKAYNMSMIDSIWDKVLLYRSNFLADTGLINIDHHPFSLTLYRDLTKKISSIERKIFQTYVRYNKEGEEYEGRLQYILKTEDELGAAKDIRIFGLRGWLEELYARTMRVYAAYRSRIMNVFLGVRVLDVVLTFVRNAVAYMYLIVLVVNGKIDIATFLLLFTAVGGFAQWVTGILKEFNNLHLQSINISLTREFLEYAEPFKFDEGEHLEADSDRRYEIRLENVSFRYPGADKDTLTGINLTLHPEEKLAVV